MVRTAVLVAVLIAVAGGCESQKKGGAPAATRPAEKSAGATSASEAATMHGDDGFRRAFSVDARALRSHGTGEYIDLTPGRTWLYRSQSGQLKISVLDQTRMVDGVETRIVEERESEGGALVEVSRNFFAIDPASGDVYYFGEEVDVYKGGRVTGHPGAWESGRGAARFGLALPGRPRVGDKYYQEFAPGVAMDRGEVVSVEETVETPAGGFARCVHVRETTALEPGDVSQKWYAPGVGLIKDDEMELIAYTTGGP